MSRSCSGRMTLIWEDSRRSCTTLGSNRVERASRWLPGLLGRRVQEDLSRVFEESRGADENTLGVSTNIR